MYEQLSCIVAYIRKTIKTELSLGKNGKL